MAASARVFSVADVKKHAKREDLWVIISGKVYDVTKFVDEHPGGEDVLVGVAGSDATKEFYAIGHSEEAIQKELPKLLIGVVGNAVSSPASAGPLSFNSPLDAITKELAARSVSFTDQLRGHYQRAAHFVASKGISSGLLDIAAFTQYCTDVLTVDAPLVPFLFRAFDLNRDGRLDPVELIQSISQMENDAPGPRLNAVQFRMLDMDCDGRLSREDLQQFLTVLQPLLAAEAPPEFNEQGVAVHLQQCNECSGPIIGTRFLCQNCSAGIMDSYDLCQGCKAKESVMKKHPGHLFEAFLSRETREDSVRYIVAKTFGLVDTDKDGVISLQDAQAFPDFFQFFMLPGAETEEVGAP